MPRLASARLMERPEDARTFRGSGRRSWIVTRWPRRARRTARSVPARPAPTSVISSVSRGVLGELLNARSTDRGPQDPDEALHFLEPVVERHRGDPDHVRIAPVARHAGRLDPFERRPAGDRAGLHAERKLAAAPTRLGRREDLA